MPELEPAQLQAAILVAQGLSTKEAADRVGVSLRTVQRWQKLDLFIETIQSLSSKVREGSVNKLADELIQENLIWEQRRRELREREWKLSNLLLEKVERLLEDADLEISPRQLSNLLEVGSDLARRAAEMWEGDLNSAIALTRRYGFNIVDAIGEKDNELEESEEENY
jgi:transposase